MHNITSFIRKYGFFTGSYSVCIWMFDRYKRKCYGTRIEKMKSNDFEVKGINNFGYLYQGDIKQEIKRIISGERKVLFYQQDDANLEKDIKTGWELNRMHHLPVLALDIKNPDVYELFKNELKFEKLNQIMDDTNAMEVSIAVINVIIACQLIKNAKIEFDEGIVQQFIKDSLKYIIKNTEKGLKYSGNHYFFNLLGVLWISYNIVGNKEIRIIRKKANNELQRLLKQMLNKDGSLYEGSTFYHCYLTNSLLSFLILNPTAKENKRFFQYAVKMYNFCRYASFKDKLIGIGDNDSGRLLPLPEYFSYSSIDVRVTKQLGDALNMIYGKIDEDNIRRLNISHGKAFGLIKLEQDHWKVAFRCDLFGDKNVKKVIGTHYHNDQLAITAWYKDKNIFVDTGVYSYIQDDNSRLHNLQTASHNTVIINEEEQNIIYNDWQYTERKAMGRIISCNSTSIEGQHNGYTDILHRRKLFINGALTIQDTIIFAKAMKHITVGIYFHLHPDVKVSIQGSNIILEDAGVILSFNHHPKCQIKIEPSRYSPDYGEYFSTNAIIVLRSVSGETEKLIMETEIHDIKISKP